MSDGKSQWKDLAAELEAAVEKACEAYRDLPESVQCRRPGPHAWSVREIIGHLIDSASNNHQRFVRLQLTDSLDFPDYASRNEDWVRVQDYQGRPWEDLFGLWRLINRHMAHLIRRVDPACIENVWVVDEDTVHTLGALMNGYVRHLHAHLEQIDEAVSAVA